MPKPIEDKEVDEILEEISELLETLNSYQRIRNLSLNPLPRSGSTSSVADPAKPSEAEVATYNTLKAQLTLMIAMLPPYAVAKLNSDQLAELNISTKIQVLTDNYKGVMEEDEAAARAKVAELRAQPVQDQHPRHRYIAVHHLSTETNILLPHGLLCQAANNIIRRLKHRSEHHRQACNAHLQQHLRRIQVSGKRLLLHTVPRLLTLLLPTLTNSLVHHNPNMDNQIRSSTFRLQPPQATVRHQLQAMVTGHKRV